MSYGEAIYARMVEAASATLGDLFDVVNRGEGADAIELRPTADSPSSRAITALLNSNVVAAVLDTGVTIESLPLPELPRQFELQLEILWRHFQADGADREAIRGAFDRIAAELYALNVDDLMLLQMAKR